MGVQRAKKTNKKKRVNVVRDNNSFLMILGIVFNAVGSVAAAAAGN